MTSIYKTAYPYYSDKKKISEDALAQDYELSSSEIKMVRKRTKNDIDAQLCFGVMLVVFKNLNYFPELTIIPNEIIHCVRAQLNIPGAQFDTLHKMTFSRNKKHIYQYYGITPWKQDRVQDFAEKIAIESSKTHNYPADIINIVLEALKKKYYEFPDFKQLDKMVRLARNTVNQRLFDDAYDSLSQKQIEQFDSMLETTDEYQRSGFNELKSLPKNPTITHFRELLKHHDWLVEFGDTRKHLKHIVPIKLSQFSEQARSLDASDLKDFAKPKRYALMLSLIGQAQTRAKDALVITFCKTIFKMHGDGKQKLENLRELSRTRTQELLGIFSEVLGVVKKSLSTIMNKINGHGGAELLQVDCDQAVAINSNNYFPFLVDFLRGKRETLLQLLKTLDIRSSTQHDLLLKAVKYILDNQDSSLEYLPDEIDLSFATDQWRKLIAKTKKKKRVLHHRYLEICIFTYVAQELRTKDLFIVGGDSYADHRVELVPWTECQKMLGEYCEKTNLANNGIECVKQLKEKLTTKIKEVDDAYPSIREFSIDKSGTPILHKRGPKRKPSSAVWLEKEIKKRMKERNLIDVFCSSHFYCSWADVFGPISGDAPKIKNPIEGYIQTTFAYATRLGPTQTAQHVRGSASAHTLSWINRRHVTSEMLDKAREKLINLYNQFKLPKSWGDGKSVAGDGTLEELRMQNLFGEFHFRYRKKGGIAYHHVADNYILLFSTFMQCGVWEAVEIIEGLLKNNSDVQPDIIHGDTQAQSTVVFALAHLLGFKLMPRIRNWKDVKLFRPAKNTKCKNIDGLFSDTIDWDLIETHWQDMMQVVLSIHKGKMSSSKLLRKLGNYSKKNRLYQAFQELGYVTRTLFLLEYISDVELREIITAQTNKVEEYNGFSDWCSFGSEILVASNDENEMEKAVKYNGILTNAVMLQNVSDMTEIIAQLIDEGHKITQEDMSYLCPYLTSHLKRFGDIVMDFTNIPRSVEANRRKVLF
jgi:TnpA family transposase